MSALVLIDADGDRLPTRARYNQRNGRGTKTKHAGSYNVGVSYRYGGAPQWYTLADAAASKLMSGKPPTIRAVLRFTAEGTQDGLEPIAIAGNRDYRVDPRDEDFIRRLVELRADVRSDHKQAKADGDMERAILLEATQQAMKITANATSYGSAIELNPVEHRKGAWVSVHLPNGGGSYRVHQDRTEDPGRWFHRRRTMTPDALAAGVAPLRLLTQIADALELGTWEPAPECSPKSSTAEFVGSRRLMSARWIAVVRT